jgi:anti-sigma factor RsiW
MQCDRTGELIGAYLDQELDAGTRREVAAHLGGCAACSALADEFGRMSRQLAALGREPAPEHVVAEVRRRFAEASVEISMPHLGAIGPLGTRRWLRHAAALLLACGLTAAATAFLMSRMAGTATVEREVAAAHVRSLLQESPMQIASAEVHAIKPWFAGRLDFAPSVKDLTAEGYPLAGARLDYIGERRVAALVYRRRLHVVNVFLWPSVDVAYSPPREIAHRGYNIIAWSKGGVAYWAISDLNMSDMRQLQAQL